jgi:hypothetical protein
MTLKSDDVFAAILQKLVTASGPAFPVPLVDAPETSDGFRLRADGQSDFLLLSSDGEAPREIARLQGGGGVDQIEAIVSLEIIYTVVGASGAARRSAKGVAIEAITAAVLSDKRLGGLAGYVRVDPAETDQDSTQAGSETAARLIVSVLVSGPEGQM